MLGVADTDSNFRGNRMNMFLALVIALLLAEIVGPTTTRSHSKGLKTQSWSLGSFVPVGCPPFALSLASNSICDTISNNLVCSFDGGDCCESTCVRRLTNMVCTGPFHCLDPKVIDKGDSGKYGSDDDKTASSSDNGDSGKYGSDDDKTASSSSNVPCQAPTSSSSSFQRGPTSTPSWTPSSGSQVTINPGTVVSTFTPTVSLTTSTPSWTPSSGSQVTRNPGTVVSTFTPTVSLTPKSDSPVTKSPGTAVPTFIPTFGASSLSVVSQRPSVPVSSSVPFSTSSSPSGFISQSTLVPNPERGLSVKPTKVGSARQQPPSDGQVTAGAGVGVSCAHVQVWSIYRWVRPFRGYVVFVTFQLILWAFLVLIGYFRCRAVLAVQRKHFLNLLDLSSTVLSSSNNGETETGEDPGYLEALYSRSKALVHEVGCAVVLAILKIVQLSVLLGLTSSAELGNFACVEFLPFALASSRQQETQMEQSGYGQHSRTLTESRTNGQEIENLSPAAASTVLWLYGWSNLLLLLVLLARVASLEATLVVARGGESWETSKIHHVQDQEQENEHVPNRRNESSDDNEITAAAKSELLVATERTQIKMRRLSLFRTAAFWLAVVYLFVLFVVYLTALSARSELSVQQLAMTACVCQIFCGCVMLLVLLFASQGLRAAEEEAAASNRLTSLSDGATASNRVEVLHTSAAAAGGKPHSLNFTSPEWASFATDNVVQTLFLCFAVLAILSGVPDLNLGSMWAAFVGYSLLSRVAELLCISSLYVLPIRLRGATSSRQQRVLTRLLELSELRSSIDYFETPEVGDDTPSFASATRGSFASVSAEGSSRSGIHQTSAKSVVVGGLLSSSSLLTPSLRNGSFGGGTSFAQRAQADDDSATGTLSPVHRASFPSIVGARSTVAGSGAGYQQLPQLGNPESPAEARNWTEAWEGRPIAVKDQVADLVGDTFSLQSGASRAGDEGSVASSLSSAPTVQGHRKGGELFEI